LFLVSMASSSHSIMGLSSTCLSKCSVVVMGRWDDVGDDDPGALSLEGGVGSPPASCCPGDPCDVRHGPHG
jgi:hypothetical protein